VRRAQRRARRRTSQRDGPETGFHGLETDRRRIRDGLAEIPETKKNRPSESVTDPRRIPEARKHDVKVQDELGTRRLRRVSESSEGLRDFPESASGPAQVLRRVFCRVSRRVESSRVRVGSHLGSCKVSGSLGCVSGPCRVSRVRRKRGIAVSLCHRAPKRTIRVGE